MAKKVEGYIKLQIPAVQVQVQLEELELPFQQESAI